MRRFFLLVAAFALVLSSGTGSAVAFEGGGKKPSEAPPISWGAHYEALLGNNRAEANYAPGGCCDNDEQVAIYRLGPLSVHDQVSVNWHALPFSGGGSGYPVRLVFVENIDDYTWGSTFGGEWSSDDAFGLSGSGTAHSEVTVKNSSATDYLEFFSQAETTNPQEFETYPYDFSVEAPRHYLSVSLGPVDKVATNGSLQATATLANGGSVPDGFSFTLTGTWSDGGVFTTTATSTAGQIKFPLALPESAIGQDVDFVVTSAATAEYQAATSQRIYVDVTAPPAPPTPAPVAKAPKTPHERNRCLKATARAHVLARQYRRQLKHARRARGRARHRLLHHAHATGLRFRAARSARKVAC